MQDPPDPNLDDEDLIQACFECSESIHRGDECTMCDATWHDHRMIHHPGCLFVVVGEMLFNQHAIEDALDGAP